MSADCHPKKSLGSKESLWVPCQFFLSLGALARPGALASLPVNHTDPDLGTQKPLQHVSSHLRIFLPLLLPHPSKAASDWSRDCSSPPELLAELCPGLLNSHPSSILSPPLPRSWPPGLGFWASEQLPSLSCSPCGHIVGPDLGTCAFAPERSKQKAALFSAMISGCGRWWFKISALDSPRGSLAISFSLVENGIQISTLPQNSICGALMGSGRRRTAQPCRHPPSVPKLWAEGGKASLQMKG